MDYPKSVPSVGLVNGKFVDENPVTGTPGSLIPAAWGNGVTQEILNVLAAAGIVADEAKNDQLAAAIAALVDWSKLKNKPTTLQGYGITNALQVGVLSQQFPSLAAPAPGGTEGLGMGGAMQIREAQGVGNTKTDFEYAPRVVFHWQGMLSRDLAMTTTGELRWGGAKVWTSTLFDPATKANAVDVTNALATKASKAELLALTSSLDMSTAGRLTLPTASGNFILQWCEGPLCSTEGTPYPAVNFPVAFPGTCVFAGAFTRSTTDNTQSDQIFQVSSWDRLGVKLFPQWFGTGTQGLVRPLIFAIGQ